MKSSINSKTLQRRTSGRKKTKGRRKVPERLEDAGLAVNRKAGDLPRAARKTFASRGLSTWTGHQLANSSRKVLYRIPFRSSLTRTPRRKQAASVDEADLGAARRMRSSKRKSL